MKRILSMFLAILTLTALIFSSVSCDDDSGDRDEGELPLAQTGFDLMADGYVVLRSDTSSDTVTKAAVALKNAINEKTGLEIMVKTDWDGKEDNSNRREILVGETNRELSKSTLESLGSDEFAIVLDGCLAIIGANDELTAQAVDYFIANYIDAGLTLFRSEWSGTQKGKAPETEPPEVIVTEPNLRENGVAYDFISSVVMTNEQNLDEAYLFENSAWANSGVRFADKSGEIVYKFDIGEMTEPTISLYISQNYIVEVSPENDNYTIIADYSKISSTHIRDAGNATILTVDPYEYEIYDTLYVRIRNTDINEGHGGAISQFTINNYKPISNGGENLYLKSEEDKQMAINLSSALEPTEVEGYKLASDGGLIYNPISREKEALLGKYDSVEKKTVTLEADGVKVNLSYPENVTAYDAVPITYTLSNPEGKKYVHIGANTSQPYDKDGLYDLNLPGTVDIEYEYLGYVTADYDTSNRAQVFPDGTVIEGERYPNYTTHELTKSGELRYGDITWFRFRYTNVGNTVLDSDGSGTFCFAPYLYIKNGSNYEFLAQPENLFYRLEKDLYPGESDEIWVAFTAYSRPLNLGEYKLVMNGIVRNETANPENYGKNIWGGETYCATEFYFSIVDDPAETEMKIKKQAPKKATRNKWLHTYEEFMSSFDTWLKPEDGDVSATMYVQPAPWSDALNLRLIIGDSKEIARLSLPLNVETDSLKVEFNPDNNNYVILEDGTRFPAITAQSMVDMRANVQLGPDAAGNVIKTLVDMQEAGVNLVTSTAAFGYDGGNQSSVSNNIDAFWFSVDVMRELGLTLEGYVTYPYESNGNIGNATWIDRERISALQADGTSSEKLLAIANGILSIYQFKRWGDQYWLGANDEIVLSVEDTRGWMRVDYNARLPMGDALKNRFRIYLAELYGSIDEVNRAWGTSYASFEEIDPEEGTTADHSWLSYKNKKAPFAEWSRMTMDLDNFRTYARVEDYLEVIKTAEEGMPTTRLNLRTEGANWTATVDPTTTNSHYRHVYYSQRRCAIVPEVLGSGDVLYSHSDYTTLPYTPSEVAYLTRSSIENGIIPMHLPQFNRMRDIASNKRYGNDFKYEYNTKGDTAKGAYINTVCSVYEWFKAIYENGGVPGILWQDYLCDGCATPTQRKEIAFFTEKLKEALSEGEGLRWATEFEDNRGEILSASNAKNTFNADYVADLIDKYMSER